jgi:molecular chaperone DnaK
MRGVIGIDFGTTNSLISIVLSDRVISFVDGNLPHPSMVCYADGKAVVGAAAKKRFEGQGHSETDGIVRSPKRLLGQGMHYVLGREMEPAQIVADLMRYLRDHAMNWGIADSGFDHAVVSIPVAMDGRRRGELRDALLQAGIGIVQFVHEPLAALYAHFRDLEEEAKSYQELADQLALVFDWGGGTLDLTLCHLGNGTLSQIANFGDNEVGGDYIDEALMRFVLEEMSREKSTGKKLLEAPGARAKLLEQCEKAKIELSKRDSAIIYVPNFYTNAGDDNDIDLNLTRECFQRVAERFINRGIGVIDELLLRLNIDRRRIALCLATGGMIHMPAIHSALVQLFGADRLHISPRGDRIISEGCAWIAEDESRLKLAKPLELAEARENYLPVFKPGDPLPVAGETIAQNLLVYCVDPRDGIAKIKLARPRFLGKCAATDPRDNYASVAVRVESQAKPFMERIDVELNIDHDLIVRVTARSTLLEDFDYAEILDLECALDAATLINGSVIEDIPDSAADDVGPRLSDGSSGDIVSRSNVSTKKEMMSLVPGELLHTVNRRLFDPETKSPLPQQLHDEKNFYQPCSLCGRRFNHPLCKCASSISGPSKLLS